MAKLEVWLTFTSDNEQRLYLHFSVAIICFLDKERDGRAEGQTLWLIGIPGSEKQKGISQIFIILGRINSFSENFKLFYVHVYVMSRYRPNLAG